MNNELMQEINACVSALRRNELVIFPDETGWSIGCSMKSEENIKSLSGERLPVLLMDDFSGMHKFCTNIPPVMGELNEYTTKPLNFEIENPVNIPEILLNNNNANFRIPKDSFVKILVNKFYHVSGTLLVSFLLDEQENIKEQARRYNGPVYVVNLRRSQKTDVSSLVTVRVSSRGHISILKN